MCWRSCCYRNIPVVQIRAGATLGGGGGLGQPPTQPLGCASMAVHEGDALLLGAEEIGLGLFKHDR